MTISYAKREKGKIIYLKTVTTGTPNKDYIEAAARYFIYLTEKYGLKEMSHESN